MSQTRTTILIVFTLALVGLVFWFASQDPKPQPVTLQSSSTANIANGGSQALQPVAASLPAPNAALSTQTPASHSSSSLLEQEKQKLMTLRQTIQGLQQQRQEQARQTGAANSSRMSKVTQDNEQIQNLLDILQEDRLAENDLNEAAANSLREQNSAAQAARDEVDQNIELQTQEIQRTQDQISALPFTSYIESEDEARLADLQNILAAQQQRLGELRAQRVDISANVMNQTQAVTQTTEQNKAVVVSDEGSIRNQIESLRTEISQLQSSRGQVRSSSYSPIDSQLRQARQAYVNQEMRVRALEANQIR